MIFVLEIPPPQNLQIYHSRPKTLENMENFVNWAVEWCDGSLRSGAKHCIDFIFQELEGLCLQMFGGLSFKELEHTLSLEAYLFCEAFLSLTNVSCMS